MKLINITYFTSKKETHVETFHCVHENMYQGLEYFKYIYPHAVPICIFEVSKCEKISLKKHEKGKQK